MQRASPHIPEEKFSSGQLFNERRLSYPLGLYRFGLQNKFICESRVTTKINFSNIQNCLLMTRTKFYLYPTKLHIAIKGKTISEQKFQNWILKKGQFYLIICVICFHSPTIQSCSGYQNCFLLGLDKIGFWKKKFPETTFHSKGKKLLEFSNGLSQLLATNSRKRSRTSQNRKLANESF